MLERYYIESFPDLTQLEDASRENIIAHLAPLAVAFNYDTTTEDPTTLPDYQTEIDKERDSLLDSMAEARTYTVIFARDTYNNNTIVGFALLDRPKYWDENDPNGETIEYGLAYVHPAHREQHIFSSMSSEAYKIAR